MRRTQPNTPEPVRRRLHAQRLSHSAAKDVTALVRWMGAVQAQDYNSVRWALGARLSAPVTEADVEAAFASGAVIRTHAFRGTWQAVAPDDAAWMVAAVGPRVIAAAGTRLRQLGLDSKTLAKSEGVLVKAIDREGPRTREELAKALQRARISTEGQRLPHLLFHAELRGLLCGGARRGKQFTWQLLRADALGPSGDDALAEIARRYFQSRGPATLDDFFWWSGLKAADARAALEAAKPTLVSETVEGREYWQQAAAPSPEPSPRAVLLPGFDEWLVGYRRRDEVLDPKHKNPVNQGGGIIGMCVVVDGRVVGTWKRTLRRGGVEIGIELFEPLSAAAKAEVEAAAERYASFLGTARAPTGTAPRPRRRRSSPRRTRS